MKTITKYQAFDGREFFDESECYKHEDISNQANEAISKLDKAPDMGCSFSNGMGYIQHEKLCFMLVRENLLEIAKLLTDHKWIQQAIDEGLSVDSSWPGRIIGELANKSLNDAWHRVSCTDDNFREWGQPYYKINPHKAEQVQLNQQGIDNNEHYKSNGSTKEKN